MKIIELNEEAGKYETVGLNKEFEEWKESTPYEVGDKFMRNGELHVITDSYPKKESFWQKNKHGIICIIQVAVGIAMIAVSFLLSSNANAECTTVYAKVGAGYKIDAARYDRKYRDDPYFVRLEAGVECKRLTFGITHGKQIYSAKSEYFRDNNGPKTAIFVDFKHEWGI